MSKVFSVHITAEESCKQEPKPKSNAKGSQKRDSPMIYLYQKGSKLCVTIHSWCTNIATKAAGHIGIGLVSEVYCITYKNAQLFQRSENPNFLQRKGQHSLGPSIGWGFGLGFETLPRPDECTVRTEGDPDEASALKSPQTSSGT